MKVKIAIAALVAVVAAVLIAAAPWSLTYDIKGTGGTYELLDGMSLNGTDASDIAARTVTKKIAGFSQVLMTLAMVDANDSVTAVTTTCTGSIDGGTTYGSLTQSTDSAGTGTSVAYVRSHATGSGTTRWVQTFDSKYIWGLDMLKCQYDATGTPAGVDVLDVQWSLVVGR